MALEQRQRDCSSATEAVIFGTNKLPMMPLLWGVWASLTWLRAGSSRVMGKFEISLKTSMRVDTSHPLMPWRPNDQVLSGRGAFSHHSLAGAYMAHVRAVPPSHSEAEGARRTLHSSSFALPIPPDVPKAISKGRP